MYHIQYGQCTLHIRHRKTAIFRCCRFSTDRCCSVHARTLANRRRQIADIDFVKYSKQRATTSKSDPSPAAVDDHPRRRAPWRSAMWVVVGGRRRERQRTPQQPVVRRDRCDTANDRHWDNYRRSALFVQGGRRVGLCVFVNAVCAGEQCTCETCVRAWYRTPTNSGRQRRSAVT